MMDAFQVHVSSEWPDLPLPRSNSAVRPRFLQAPYVVTPPRLPLLMSLVLTPKSYESGQLLYQAGANVLENFSHIHNGRPCLPQVMRPSTCIWF